MSEIENVVVVSKSSNAAMLENDCKMYPLGTKNKTITCPEHKCRHFVSFMLNSRRKMVNT